MLKQVQDDSSFSLRSQFQPLADTEYRGFLYSVKVANLLDGNVILASNGRERISRLNYMILRIVHKFHIVEIARIQRNSFSNQHSCLHIENQFRIESIVFQTSLECRWFDVFPPTPTVSPALTLSLTLHFTSSRCA